ncbi:hypothetical protein [Nonomuraea rhodomycinica]|uniref:Phage-related protein n=1 Tax=Nonomuraea rhodomycinica TaxID=1712872 RepID=A0A7Y6IWM6_9ACTN|nr:hypothetical protein [Nonomuraea rhodomycinica]NUW45540.1 hypothetical protein [Nonomuraea rhodomycinica]
MPGTPLAEAYVRVRALTDRFKDDVERGFAGLGDQFGKQFSQEAANRLRDERGRFAAAGRDLGDAAGDAAGEEFGRRMAEAGAVRFGDDGAPFVAAGKRLGGDAGDAGGQEFSRRFWRDANGRWRDERGRFVSAGEALGEAAGDGINRGIDRRMRDGHGSRLGETFGRAFVDGLGGSLSKLGDLGKRALDAMLPSLGRFTAGLGAATSAAAGLLATVGKWAAVASGVAALGAAAASAAGYTVALAASLAPLGGLLAALPGVALAGAAAFSVWKLATGGLGEAMGAALSGNAKKLEEALGKLSESGRAFITEFQQAIPLLQGFKAVAQDAFLEPLLGQMERWLTSANVLRPAIAGLAGEFGGMVRTVLDFATADRTLGQFNTVIGDTHTLVGALNGALQPLLRGFVDLGTVGSSWLAGLSGGLTDSLTRFGEWMSRVSAGGQAWAWMDRALAVLKQLGALAKDLWDIFDGLMDAARTAGGDALGVLGQLVDVFARWVKSAQGQDVLVTVFRALNDIGRALLPIIQAVGGAVAAIAPEAAKLATALGPVLAQAIAALGPAIAAVGPGIVAMIHGIGQAVAALAPAMLPLGQAIAAAFATLKPLLAAIGPAIAALLPGVQAFFGAFALGVAQLAPALQPLGAALGGILSAIAPLLPVVGQLAALIATSLAGGVQAILPSLQRLVGALGQALAALAPIVPMVVELAASVINALVPALAPLLPQIAALITHLVQGLVPALTPLMPIIGQLVGVIGQAFVSVLGELIGVILQILPPLTQTAQIIGLALLDAVRQVAPYIPQLVGAFLSFLPALVNLLPPLADLAVSLMPRFIDAVVAILPHLPALIRSMVDLNQAMLPLLPVFTDLLKRMAPHIPLFIELAAVIAERVLPQITKFLIIVTQTVGGVIQKFTELYDRLIGHSIIPDLINGIKNWISGLPDMFARWFGQAKDWAIGKFNELLNWVRGLPGAITGALGNMGSLLGGAGRDLIVGFWNGMVGMYNWLRDSLYNFFRGIMPDWVRDALGIHSPSRLFAEIGKQLPAGLVVGMDAGQPMIQSAAQRMADATVGAFTEPASPAPAFDGAFAAPAAAPGAAAAGGGVTIENLTVRGILDPRDPGSFRRMVEEIRQEIRTLDREVYAG